MKDQDLDKLFSDNLKDHEITPPTSVWQGIESKLEEEKIIPIKRNKNWQIWTIAACCLLALGFSIKILLFQENKESLNSKEIVLNKEIIQDNSSVTTIDEPLQALIEPDLNQKNEDKLVASVEQKSIKKPVRRSFVKEKNQEPEDKTIVFAKSQDSKDKLIPAEKMDIISPIELGDIDQNKIELSAVEVVPIQPLVNIIEQEEIMYAEVKKEPKKKQSIFTNILNTLTENLNPTSKSVKFSSDEEGTIKIDLYNSIAKTRR